MSAIASSRALAGGLLGASLIWLAPGTGVAGQHGGQDGGQGVAAGSAGDLAAAGHEVYMTVCAVCHGEEGEGRTGPALIGSDAALQHYSTAKGLLDYMSLAMPSQAPGSLEATEYRDLLAYLLVENGYVAEDAPLGAADLSAIPLDQGASAE